MDVIKRYCQLVLIIGETSTSLTTSCLLNDKHHGFLQLCLELRPPTGTPSLIKVDTAPGFASAQQRNPSTVSLTVEVVRVQNPNKNLVVEKCVAEPLRICPEGGPVTPISLAVVTANLNTHICNRGLSAHERSLQCDQFTKSDPFVRPLTLSRTALLCLCKHPGSESSKAACCCLLPPASLQISDLAYIISDGFKTDACNRHLIVSINTLRCNVRRFTRSQLCSISYCIRLSECYRVPDQTETMFKYADEKPIRAPISRIPQNITPALIPEDFATLSDPHSASLVTRESPPAPVQ